MENTFTGTIVEINQSAENRKKGNNLYIVVVQEEGLALECNGIKMTKGARKVRWANFALEVGNLKQAKEALEGQKITLGYRVIEEQVREYEGKDIIVMCARI